jgi:hypothetical protein
MRERESVTRILVGHFFRRFFDNDTIQVDGDTQTTVVRAIAIVAAPGLMVAFFMQNQYWRSPAWVATEDRYFFVLLSFVAMGAVSIFEWEMLFPDRLDFLVLSPLPVKPIEMLAAKAAALIGFLALFLVASSLFGTVMLPALTHGDGFFHRMVAHGAAVLLAGVFAALFFLALGGVLLCVLDGAQFRVLSPVMQMVSAMALVLLMIQYARYGESMQAWFAEPLGRARWLPPLWFLGVYEQLLQGDAAPAFALEMTRYAVRGTAAAGAVVLLTYPVAWARMRRMAVEGSSRRRGQPSRWLARLVHGVVRRPGERAAFHFIGQTIRRNNRYQIYLAMYWGIGLALAMACAVTFSVSGGSLHPALSGEGLHAMMPLLLFWVIAGLRTAFAFPLDLSARWVFRVSGVNIGECAAAARRWALVCALGVMGSIVAALCVAGWDARHLLVQAVCGLCLCVLLTDGFFFSQRSAAFNQPRMPGRTNFPLMLTLYVGALPMYIYATIYLETRMERNLGKLLLPAFAAASIHALTVLGRGPDEIEEEMEGYDAEFQLLGLS